MENALIILKNPSFSCSILLSSLPNRCNCLKLLPMSMHAVLDMPYAYLNAVNVGDVPWVRIVLSKLRHLRPCIVSSNFSSLCLLSLILSSIYVYIKLHYTHYVRLHALVSRTRKRTVSEVGAFFVSSFVIVFVFVVVNQMIAYSNQQPFHSTEPYSFINAKEKKLHPCRCFHVLLRVPVESRVVSRHSTHSLPVIRLRPVQHHAFHLTM